VASRDPEVLAVLNAWFTRTEVSEDVYPPEAQQAARRAVDALKDHLAVRLRGVAASTVQELKENDSPRGWEGSYLRGVGDAFSIIGKDIKNA
jgi:hypothetical protein